MLKIKNPYPGIEFGISKPFDETTKDYFFGREKDIDNLRHLLRKNRFVSLLSPSQYGKTSLLKAGLIPHLTNYGFHALFGSNWKTIIFEPERNPISTLADALSVPHILYDKKMPPHFSEILFSQLMKNDNSLIYLCEESELMQQSNLLIVIDDFERLFKNYTIDEAIQHRFINLLLNATKTKHIAVYVIFSMNSDITENPAYRKNSNLMDAIRLSHYYLLNMQQEELLTAILQPAQKDKFKFSDDLVQKLIQELLFDKNQLTKLQDYLSKTWLHWKNEHKPTASITLRHFLAATKQSYKPTIEVGKSADKQKLKADDVQQEIEINTDETPTTSIDSIEKIYHSFSPKQQTECKIVFQLLTVLPSKEQKIELRDLSLDDLVQISQLSASNINTLLKKFDTIITVENDLIHIKDIDSIQDWDLLQQWVEEERKNAQTYKDLAGAAVEHFIKNIPSEEIWSQDKFEEVHHWMKTHNPNESWALLYDKQYTMAIDFLRKGNTTQTSDLIHENIERENNTDKSLSVTTPNVRANPPVKKPRRKIVIKRKT